MGVLTVRTSLSLAGITEEVTETAGPRALIEWAASVGYRAVQLDGAMGGLRARELDRSARRDLAALLRRVQLELSGVDLWIPRTHFADAGQQDRAVAAVVGALELASDLSRLAGGTPVVSLSLPEKLPAAVLDSLTNAADRVGAVLADHSWPARGEARGPLRAGVDPAEVLAARADPAAEVSRLSAAPAGARLSDFANAARVAIGRGQLDVLAYQIALMTKGFTGYGVVDLRGVRNQAEAAEAALGVVGGPG